jgi:probable rRNA maturation factor
MGAGDQRRFRVIASTTARRAAPLGGLERWLRRVAPASARGEVGVALVTDACVRALNRRYLHRDYATDVLSFPFEAARPAGRRRRPAPSGRGAYLGDIVIARGVARRQARAAGHAEQTEWRLLALHGLLHLLGYDHERDHGAMARAERRLRRKGRLREGLLERGAASGLGPAHRR